MTARFYVEDRAIRGRAGIFDSEKGNRMVCFFLNDPTDARIAPAMARVCADALNAAAERQKGGRHELPVKTSMAAGAVAGIERHNGGGNAVS